MGFWSDLFLPTLRHPVKFIHFRNRIQLNNLIKPLVIDQDWDELQLLYEAKKSKKIDYAKFFKEMIGANTPKRESHVEYYMEQSHRIYKSIVLYYFIFSIAKYDLIHLEQVREVLPSQLAINTPSGFTQTLHEIMGEISVKECDKAFKQLRVELTIPRKPLSLVKGKDIKERIEEIIDAESWDDDLPFLYNDPADQRLAYKLAVAYYTGEVLHEKELATKLKVRRAFGSLKNSPHERIQGATEHDCHTWFSCLLGLLKWDGGKVPEKFSYTEETADLWWTRNPQKDDAQKPNALPKGHLKGFTYIKGKKIQYKGARYDVYFDEILWIETNSDNAKHTLYIKISDPDHVGFVVKRPNLTLTQLSRELPQESFLHVSGSHIINKYKVTRVGYSDGEDFVEIAGKNIPVTLIEDIRAHLPEKYDEKT